MELAPSMTRRVNICGIKVMQYVTVLQYLSKLCWDISQLYHSSHYLLLTLILGFVSDLCNNNSYSDTTITHNIIYLEKSTSNYNMYVHSYTFLCNSIS